MPRFFFHIDDGQFFTDTEGTELPDLAAARTQAVTTAGEILADVDGAFWHEPNQWRMHVADENDRLLFTLNLSAEIPSGDVTFLPGRLD